MASLYKSVEQTRKIVIIILIVVGLILLWNIYRGITAEEDIILPGEAGRFYMQTNPIFGEVPQPTIPGIEYNQDAEFVLESIHSQGFPDVSYVYSVTQPREGLLSRSNAESTAQALGFEPRGYTSQGSTLTWISADGTKTLSYNLQSRTWDLMTRYSDNEAALQRKNMLTGNSVEDVERQYSQTITSLLRALGFNSYGLTTPLISSKLIQQGIDGIFINVQSTAEAQYARSQVQKKLPLADLKPTAERPEGEPPVVPGPATVYSDDPRDGQINFIVSNQVRDYARDIFEMEFTDFEYDTRSIGAYSIVTPDEAWNNVQRGNGSLVFIFRQSSNYFADYSSIEVRRFRADARLTELAFYEPNEWSGFTTPIYVFRGIAELASGERAEFIFFTDAIKRLT
jgi:hypothetical protein